MMSSPDVCTFLGSGDSVRGANRDIVVALSSQFAPRTENIGNAAATFQRWNRVIAKAHLIVLLCSIAWLFSAESAKSQIIDWTNSSGTPWLHDPANWNGGVLPGSTNTARFQLPGANNVWWDSTTAAAVPDVRMVHVLNGQLIFLNRDAGPQHSITNLETGLSAPWTFISSGDSYWIIYRFDLQRKQFNRFTCNIDFEGPPRSKTLPRLDRSPRDVSEWTYFRSRIW